MMRAAFLHLSLSEVLGAPTRLMAAYQVIKMDEHLRLGFAIDLPTLAQLHQEAVELYDAQISDRYDLDMGHCFADKRIYRIPESGYITTRGMGVWDSDIDWHVLMEFGAIRFFTPKRPLVTYCPKNPVIRRLQDASNAARQWHSR